MIRQPTMLQHKYLPLSLLLAMLMAIGCSSPKPLQNSAADATLWMQNAAEYKALTRTIYQAAETKLDTALESTSWTAYEAQKDANYQKKPPAIVLDVDETVLDNSAFQARLIKQHASYSSKKWNRWVYEEQADPIPGALRFLQHAAQKGITIFYITNREASLRQATYKNLKQLHFPLPKGKQAVLTKNERPRWNGTKENRRKYIAKNYRIIMFFGDNLNDFLPAIDISHQKRLKLVKTNRKKFGTKWFILPNPAYGSWQGALYDFDDSLSAKQIQQQKMRMLHTKQ